MKIKKNNYILAALFSLSTLHAADVTWNGSADGTWGNATNWTGGLPASNTPVFSALGAGNLNTTLSTSVSVTGLKFNNDAPGNATINVSIANKLNIASGSTVAVTAGDHVIIGPGTASGTGNQEITLAGTSTWNIATGATLTNQARTTRSGGTSDFTKTGGGTLIVDNDNGNTTGSNNHFKINQGTLRFTTFLGIGLSNNPITVSSGATVEMTNGASSQRGVVTLNGSGVGGAGAYLLSSGNGLTHTNATDANGKMVLASDSSIGVASGATLTTTRPLEESGGARSLTKVGNGIFTINTAATYTGATNINAGTLKIGASGTSLSSSANIASGAIFDVSAFSPFLLPANFKLSGSGTINGLVEDALNTKICPGSAVSIGELTFDDDLELTGKGSLEFDFDTATTSDQIFISGNLNPIGVTPIHIKSKPLGGFTTGSTYDLIQVAGTLGGSAANFTIVNDSRSSFSLAYAGNNVTMTVVAAASPENLVWSGGLSGNAWDINTTANWNTGAQKFFVDDTLSFTDIGVANSPVDLAVAVAPAAVLVNSTGAYEITGTGKISGTSSLTKNNTGTLTLSTVNDYSGSTIVNGGTLKLGTASAIPSGSGKGDFTLTSGTLDLNGFSQGINNLSGAGIIDNTFTAAATLTVDCSMPSVFTGIIQNAADPVSLTKTGASSLTLSGTSTYTGTTTVGGSGVLNINSASAIGSGNLLISGGGIDNISGAAITLTNGNTISNDTVRDITFEGSNDLTTSGLLTYNSSRRSVVTNGTGKLTVGGIAGSAAAILVKNGTGTFEVTGPANTNVNGIEVRNGLMIMSGANNTYAGTTNIGVNNTGTRIGTLRAAASGTLGTSTVDIGPGGNDATATLELAGSISLANAISVTGRNNSSVGLRNISGNNTISGTVTLNSGGTDYRFESQSGELTLGTSGSPAITPSVSTATRRLTFDGSGNGVVAGNMNFINGTLAMQIEKVGSGKWTIAGALAFSGNTTVTGGILEIAADDVFADASTVTLADSSSLNLTHSGTDTVTTLVINGVTQPNGIYTFGTGKLKVGISTPFEDWALLKGLDGTAGKENGLTDDPDKDGSTNLAEFAFHGNPLSGADNGIVRHFTADSSDAGTDVELVLTIAVRSGTPVFTGTPSPTATHDGITYSVEGTTDLNTFATNILVVDPHVTGLPSLTGSGYEYRSFSLSGSNGLPAKGFLRSKVASP
jgi:autotransporter-associated beta strand protein